MAVGQSDLNAIDVLPTTNTSPSYSVNFHALAVHFGAEENDRTGVVGEDPTVDDDPTVL